MSQTTPPPLIGPGTWIFLSVSVCMLSRISRVRLFSPMDCSPPDCLSVGFSRQEYWSGYPFPSPGDLPDSGIEPTSLCLLHLSGRFFTSSTTREAQCCQKFCLVFLLYSQYGLWHLVGAHLHKHLLKKKSQRMNRWMDFWAWYPDTVFLNLMTVINKEMEREKILMLSLSHKVYLTQKTQGTFRGFVHPGGRWLEYLTEKAHLSPFLKPLVQANPAD